MTDVLVIGGGVIGLLAAWRLAQAGLSVELFERGQPGGESSAAALGLLSPQADPDSPPELLQLSLASLRLFPALKDELQDVSGVDIELRDGGMLATAADEEEAEALADELRVQQAAGGPVSLLSGLEARDMELALWEGVRAALHFTAARLVDNVRLCNALMLATARAGVRIRAGEMVTHLLSAGGRVQGVRAGEDEVGAPWVVLAAGCWSGSIEGLSMPVRPAKGQAVALEAPLVVSRALHDSACLVVPRRDGRLLVGATVEEACFDKRSTASAVQELLSAAIRFLPALKEATVLSSWAGLRPRSADDLPILGPIPGREGLIAATGHFRNGILLAPITAEMVRDWVMSVRPRWQVAPFSPGRFD